MRRLLKFGTPQNPCLFLAKGNGSLVATDRNGDFSLTASGALRYQPANGARVNLVRNPLTGNSSTGWGNASATVVPTNERAVPFGTYALKATLTATNINLGARLGGGSVVTTPGSSYAISYHVYHEMATAKDFLVRVAWSQFPEINSVGAAGGPSVTVQPFTWTRVTAVFTAAAQTSTVVVGCYIASGTTGDVFYVNAVQVEQGSASTPYFDGSTGGVWLDPISGQLGTPHASPSVSKAAFWVEEGTTNLIRNPQLASATTDWNATTGTVVTRDTAYAYIGSAALKVVCDGTVASQGVDAATGIFAAANAQAWTVSAWVRGSGTVQLQLIERDAGNAAVASGSGPGVVLSDQWTRISFTYTTTNATIATIQPRLRTTVQAATTFWSTNWQLEQKAYATSYTDGSLGTGYTWAGTAHASSSTRANTSVTADETGHMNSFSGSMFVLAAPDILAGHDQEVIKVGDGTAGLDQFRLVHKLTTNILNVTWTSNGAGGVAANVNANWLNGQSVALYTDWDGTAMSAVYPGLSAVKATRAAPSGSLASASDLRIGSFSGSTNIFDGKIGPVAIFDRPLTDAELAKVIALGPDLDFTSLKKIA